MAATLTTGLLTLFVVAFFTVSALLLTTRQQNRLLQEQRQELIGVVDSQLTATANWLAKHPYTDELRHDLLQRAAEHAGRINSFAPTDKAGRIAHAQSL